MGEMTDPSSAAPYGDMMNDRFAQLREENLRLERHLGEALVAVLDFQVERRKQKDEIERLRAENDRLSRAIAVPII